MRVKRTAAKCLVFLALVVIASLQPVYPVTGDPDVPAPGIDVDVDVKAAVGSELGQ